MKYSLLAAALLSATFAFAQTPNYEVSGMLGYNMAEGNVGFDGDDYFLGGLELQYNYAQSAISPELSILVAPGADYEGGGDTSVTRLLFNGVYNLADMGGVKPFVKAGLGYEFVSTEIENYNEDGVVLDAGAGIKYALTPSWALKAEALYLTKVISAHNDISDNNLITMVGLSYTFGAKAQPEPKPVKKVVVVEETVVIVKPEKDSDGDGIYDALDTCPNTPANSRVDIHGCKVSLDDDNDGVLNENDNCPNTPEGTPVNVDGCALKVNLEVNFANNSAVVPASADARLDAYAEFLKKYPIYSAKIVGYTDSRGSASYNQKLSQRRAEAVMNALIQRGVSADRLSALGRGEADPVADNATAEGRAQNRRIEAELIRN